MAIRGLFLVALLSVSVLAALTLTTAASALRGTTEIGLSTTTTASTTGATGGKTVASRRFLTDSGFAPMPSSPKPKDSLWKKAGKACLFVGNSCAKMIADNLTKKNAAKLVAGAVVSGGGMAVDAASGAAAAAKGDKKGATDAMVNVVKGAGSLAASTVAGPVGTVAFNAATFAGGKAKPLVEKEVKKQQQKQKKKREEKREKKQKALELKQSLI